MERGSHTTPVRLQLLPGHSLRTGVTTAPLPQGWLLHPWPPTHTCLGLALEVEGQHVLPRSSLTLTDHEEAVVPGPPCQNQLSGPDPGQCSVEPGVLAQFQLGLNFSICLRTLLP